MTTLFSPAALAAEVTHSTFSATCWWVNMMNGAKIKERNLEQAVNGASLTRDESSASYVIIRHNIRTYRSAGVVEVIKGRQNAETAVRKLETCQSPADHHEGWRYFFEKSDLKAGIDPAEATDLRQADLEIRESKALREVNTFMNPRRPHG